MQNDIYHWGILGQKWGVRRYQNPDGSLTEEGKRRYYASGGTNPGSVTKELSNYLARTYANADMVPISSMVTQVVAPTARYVSKAIKDAEVSRQKRDFQKQIKEAMKDMDDEELKEKLKRVTAENNYINQMTLRYHGTKTNAATTTADALETVATLGPAGMAAYNIWAGQAEEALRNATLASAMAITSPSSTSNSVAVAGGSVNIDIDSEELRSQIAK